MMPRWGEEMESAALGVGPDGAGSNPHMRLARAKLAHMPPRCERCRRGRPVAVLGFGGRRAVAVCAICRGGGDRDRERVRRFKAAQADTARNTARLIERARRARRLTARTRRP